MRLMRVLLTVCGALIATGTFAQMKIEVGVKGGLSNYGLDLSGLKLAGVQFNNGSGYHVGAYSLFRVAKFAVQPEIIYSRQGQFFTTPYNTNLSTHVNYINIPVMLKYYVLGGLNLQVGPQFGLVASATGDLVDKSNLRLTSSDQNLKDYLSTSDFSIAYGAALDLPFGANLTIRYVVGVTDINKYTNSANIPGTVTPSIGTSTSKNHVLQISVGYRLRKLGK
ncbi:MAG TPA: porin family protein [Cyclobacteriaceae bacterium]|nr:porin family protein [Cyclobacteriaceae bacterium]